MSAAAFDRIAARYDELWTDTPMGRAQRAQVWRHIDPLFRPGYRVLDIGCGTGADAVHLAGRGVVVHATDTSPAMVAACRKAHPGIAVSVLPAHQIASLPGTFDGALSDFGALNCIADLGPVVAGLAAKIRSGGCAAICIIGRFCLWETLRFAVRLQPRKAFRRFRGQAHSSMGITVYYPSVPQMRAAFAPHFQLERWVGVGLWPGALESTPGRVPASQTEVRSTSVVEQALAHRPGLRALADHRLLIFRRK
jgi:SAM-dependent methyltransferase